MAESSTQSRSPPNGKHSVPPTSSISPLDKPDPMEPAAFPSALRLGSSIIDRAQLERERLERQAARAPPAATSVQVKPQAEGSRPQLNGATQRNINGRGISHPSMDNPNSSAGPSRISTTQRLHPFREADPGVSDAAGRYFLDGELRHAALSIGQPSEDKTFAPAEVLGKVKPTTW